MGRRPRANIAKVSQLADDATAGDVLPIRDLLWGKRSLQAPFAILPSRAFVSPSTMAARPNLIAAAPVLREFGFNATFYLTAGSLGTPGYLSASQARDLDAQGFQIGCHSMTHPYLSDPACWFGSHLQRSKPKLRSGA